MYIIGEKLNSSVPSTLEALRKEDFAVLDSFIESQAAAGADCIDINTALCAEKESEYLKTLAEHVIGKTSCHIMLDSPRPAVIAGVLPSLGNRYVIINSVTADERLDELVPLAVKYNTGIVCMPIKSGAVPASPQERFENAEYIYNILNSAGIPDGRIYIDALAESVATNPDAGKTLLDTVKLIHGKLPDVHIVCGLSNVSFGLPKRAKINAAAVTMLISAGMDCAIADALSPSLKEAVISAEAFAGKDEYCIEYISHLRNTNQI